MSSNPYLGRVLLLAIMLCCLLMPPISASAVVAADIGSQIARGQQPILKLSQSSSFDQDLVNYTQVYQHSGADLTVRQALVLADSFRPVATRYIDFGLNAAQHWLKARIMNTSNHAGTWRVDLRRQYFQDGALYVVRERGEPQQLLAYNNQQPFFARPLQNRYLAVDVRLDPGETVTLMLRYRSDTSTWLPWRLRSIAAHGEANQREDRINWLLNGGLLVMLLVAILLSPVVSWRTSAAFVCYILAGGLFVFHSEGYAYQYIWPNTPTLNDPINLVIMLMMSLTAPWFAREFFQLRHELPIYDRIVVASVSISVLLMLLTFPLFEHDWFKRVAYAFVIWTSSLHVVTGVLVRRAQLAGSGPFLLGAFGPFFAMLFAGFAHIVPGRVSLETTLDVGHVVLVVDCVAFAAAVVVRVLAIRQERDRALRAELAVAKRHGRLQQALRAREQDFAEAQRKARRHQQALSSVSHDLAQPLASLRRTLGRVKSGSAEAEAQMQSAFDYLESVVERSITEDTRSVTKDTQGVQEESLTDSFETFDSSLVLRGVVDMFADDAQRRGLHLQHRLRPLLVHTDPVLLMRVISNLVDNAISHSVPAVDGSSRVGSILLANRPMLGAIAIEVHDTGPGMSAEAAARYLERGAKSQTSQGHGFGLAIVADLSQQLGYQVEVHSILGRGTRVRVLVPMAVQRSSV